MERISSFHCAIRYGQLMMSQPCTLIMRSLSTSMRKQKRKSFMSRQIEDSWRWQYNFLVGEGGKSVIVDNFASFNGMAYQI